MKPIIKYRGGKSKEIPQIIQYMPQFEGRYIEPFFGGGAMFFHIEPNNAIISDINVRLMNFYRSVQQNFMQLSVELADGNEALYYQLRNMYNGLIPSTYSDATLYYFINKTAYSGMLRFNAKGEYNVPYGRYKNFNTRIITEAHHTLLVNTEIHNGDYRDIFNLANPNDFVFLDPPYDCIFSDYGNLEYHDGFNEESHRQLAEDFYNLGCRALMVIGDTPLIRDLYGNNIIAEYDKNYSVNIRNRFQAEATHLIITNY